MQFIKLEKYEIRKICPISSFLLIIYDNYQVLALTLLEEDLKVDVCHIPSSDNEQRKR
jgi:hypothetical protein